MFYGRNKRRTLPPVRPALVPEAHTAEEDTVISGVVS